MQQHPIKWKLMLALLGGDMAKMSKFCRI